MHICTHAHSFNNIFHHGLSWTPSLTHKRKAGSHGPDCLSPKPGFQHPSATKRTSERIRFCKGGDSLWGKIAETAHLSDQSPVSCKGFRKCETTQNASDDIGSPKGTFTGGPGISDFIICWWFHHQICSRGGNLSSANFRAFRSHLPSWVPRYRHQAPTTRAVPYPRDAEFSTFETYSQLQPPPGDSQCTITALRSYKTRESTVNGKFLLSTSSPVFQRNERKFIENEIHFHDHEKNK